PPARWHIHWYASSTSRPPPMSTSPWESPIGACASAGLPTMKDVYPGFGVGAAWADGAMRPAAARTAIAASTDRRTSVLEPILLRIVDLLWDFRLRGAVSRLRGAGIGARSARRGTGRAGRRGGPARPAPSLFSSWHAPS